MLQAHESKKKKKNRDKRKYKRKIHTNTPIAN